MDFGFARFLEMFEERFGRSATTVLLAVLATAVAAWAAKTIIDAIRYVYVLVVSTHLMTALDNESAAAHLIILTAQIGLTFIILGIIWRLFYLRRMKALQDRMATAKWRIEAAKSEMEKKLKEITNIRDLIMNAFALHKDAVEKVFAATVLARDEINKQLPTNLRQRQLLRLHSHQRSTKENERMCHKCKIESNGARRATRAAEVNAIG